MSRRRRSPLSVKTLPLLRDDLVAHNTRIQSGQYDEEAQQIIRMLQVDYPQWQPEAMSLQDAALWWVTPPMCELAYHAASQLPDDITLSEVLPSTSGILIWEGGIGKTATSMDITTTGQPVEKSVPVRGATWSATEHGLTIGILGDDPESPLGVMPISQAPWHTDTDTQAVTATLLTTWLLSSQPTVGRTYQHQADLRRAGMRRLDLPMSVTVATLRTIATPADTGDGVTPGGHRASPSVRFLVRGHWRRQPCGPERKNRRATWISPYVKGPADAPLQVTDKVNVWRR